MELGKLQEELSTLKRSGVGKKRDMGFGDLISWEIYKVEPENKYLDIRDPMLIYSKENDIIRLITLRNLPATVLNELRKPEKEKDRKIWFLPVNMKMALSRTKPPYWLRQELCLMPFSKFWLRIRENANTSSGLVEICFFVGFVDVFVGVDWLDFSLYH